MRDLKIGKGTLMVYKNELERMRRELIERREDLLKELNDLPEGEFMCTDYDGARRYLQTLPVKGNRKKEHRYGIKKKPDLLNGLVRKEYVTNALKVVERDIRIVDAAAVRYTPADENTIMKDFIKKFPDLSGAIYHEQKEYIKYKDSLGRMDNFHPENLRHTTKDGLKMRSKNELYIASRLDHYGIVYWSDCPTGIPGLYRNPDFTIFKPRELKVLYWEHLGMMEDMEYRIDNKRKIEEYEEFGIVPWDNLILTYDTIDGGLRADYIEAIIKGILL